MKHRPPKSLKSMESVDAAPATGAGMNETNMADGGALVEPEQGAPEQGDPGVPPLATKSIAIVAEDVVPVEVSPMAPGPETSTLVEYPPTKELLHTGGTRACGIDPRYPALLASANAACTKQYQGVTAAHAVRHASVVKHLLGR